MKNPIPYQNPADLRRVQTALMHWTAEAGDCQYPHKGDVRHRLFNAGRKYTPQEILHYWLDDNDNIIAFVSLHPKLEFFDLCVAPDYRFTDFHTDAFRWSEKNLITFAKRHDFEMTKIYAENFGCDVRYDALLTAEGYTHHEHAMTHTEHDLQNLPVAPLPEGFHFYDATLDNAEKLADVHNHSFSNQWDAESYGNVFAAPLMEHEIVVVAPDGRFAAFTNVWLDDVNHSILFEPVGTHSDFRRRGIGKVLMVYVMKRMQSEHGIQRALVGHEPADKNPASGALYASIGFRPEYQIHDYVKKLS
ncbi:MAG: GNAT family N-acetyltransferase [Aggregatilineales bacterium]